MSGLAGTAVWVDGRIVAADGPSLQADDHGVLVGDGVFETLLVRGGRPLFWARHLARLERALHTTGIELSTEPLLRAAVGEVLAASSLDEGRLRLTVTSGPGGEGLRRGPTPTVVVTLAPIGPAAIHPPPAQVLTAPGARNERSPLAGIKTTSYAEAAALAARATAAGADDVLLGDSRDRLSEALTANVFVAIDGRVLTPGRDAGCLPGIVRDLILESGAAGEAEVTLAALTTADEVFLTSSVTGVRPVAAIDGRPVPVVDGPAAQRARNAVAAAEAADAASDEPLA